MKPYVYKITRINPDTKEVVYHANGQPYYYIGVHNGADPKYFAHGCRWGEYGRLKGSDTYFAKAVRKYGFESFKKEILKKFDCVHDAYAFEAELITINEVKSKNCYNTVTGGNKNPVFSREVRKKMALASQAQTTRYYYCALEGLAKPLKKIAKQYRKTYRAIDYAVENNIYWARNILKVDSNNQPIKRNIRTSTCINCGTSFIVKLSKSSFCSSKCRVKHYSNQYNSDEAILIRSKKRAAKKGLLFDSDLHIVKPAKKRIINTKTGRYYTSFKQVGEEIGVSTQNTTRGIRTGHPKYKDYKELDKNGCIIDVPIRKVKDLGQSIVCKYICSYTGFEYSTKELADKLGYHSSSLGRAYKRGVIKGYKRIENVIS